GRTASGQSQLFRGDWYDEEARNALGLPSRSTLIAQALLPIPTQTDPAIRENDLRAHVEALASDITEGRLTGTSGEKIATSYVARVFRSIGLEPAGENGSYFQNFGFTAGVSLGAGNAFTLENTSSQTNSRENFQVDIDWRPFAFSAEGAVPPSEVVYAGYGIVAPAAEGQRAIDSYADLDVENRWVLVFRYVPEQLSPESRQHLHRYSSLRHKAMVARDRGARGLLVVSGPNSEVREQLAPLRFDVSLSGSGIAAISISDALAEALLKPTNRTLRSLQDQADANSAQSGFPLQGTRVAAEIALKRLRQSGRNVLGRLQVGPEPSLEVVAVGAHVDHLGRGSGSGSLARASEKGSIHPGADDNASGVAALIEVAELLAARRDAGELGARRDILFAAWSGEELGLLGSTHWVSQETETQAKAHSGHGSLEGRVSAYLNFDMVGRLEEKPLSLFGVASSPVWPRTIERENIAIGLPIDPQEDSYLPTDATAFYTRRVPILAAFTGSHGEYHTPRDTPDKLDYTGAQGIAQLMAGIAQELASRDTPPEYIAVAPDPRNAGSPGVMRVYLGTIPDYAQSDRPGVLLSAVAPGGPAEKAGLRGGDTIISVAGQKVENIYDYTYALDALKVGTPVTIRVIRDGRPVEKEITPGSRE
ncbi:M28 family peptidase, partial [Myxococcota bacterium]|nr:M28 family peptidase [Myxococcota bacterium]